jgi:hypothetical protein
MNLIILCRSMRRVLMQAIRRAEPVQVCGSQEIDDVNLEFQPMFGVDLTPGQDNVATTEGTVDTCEPF